MIYKNNIKNKMNKFLTEKCVDDAQANAYTVSCIKWILPIVCIVLLLYSLFKFVNKFYYIALPDASVTLIGLFGSLFVITIAYLLGVIIDHTNPWLKYILIFLSIVVVTLIQVYMSYIVILTTFAPLLIAAQYDNKKVINFAYILSLISSVFIVLFNYRYGLCDANTVLMPANKISYYGQTLSGTIKPLSENFWSLMVMFVLPRIILITAFVPLINAIVKNRKETMKREVEMQFNGEHDLLTGFYNRNKYASMLKDSYQKIKNVTILFFDINNLKYTNDTYGHDVGDSLIVKAAESIRSSIGDNMDAYRFGGDEFMVVIPEGNEKDADAFIKEWQLNLEIINTLPTPVECEIAHGYASGKGEDFNEILRQADINMYENKLASKMQREI